MFAIIIPVCSAPVIGALTWSQIRAKRLGVIHSLNPNAALVQRVGAEQTSFAVKVKVWVTEVDLVGLLLLGAGWTCVGVETTAQWRHADIPKTATTAAHACECWQPAIQQLQDRHHAGIWADFASGLHFLGSKVRKVALSTCSLLRQSQW